VIRKLVQSTLRRFGYRLIRDNVAQPAYGLELFFALLKRYGFDPKHIIDVGANKGYWTRRAIQFFPDSCYTLVEPQDHLKDHIQDLVGRGCKITWINAGAGDESSVLPFNISYRDDSSTFVPLLGKGNGQISVPVKTLNEIVSSANPCPEMVKIDAEGYDLKVLAGASNLFGKTDVFLVEVVIYPEGSYENTIARVIRRMDEAGYKVVDITEINRSPKFGVLWLCELAFLRNGCRLFESAISYE
jgi:FkbM family methyltransferase